MDGKALESHHVIHALGKDGALAQLAAQLVSIHNAAHGRANDNVNISILQLFCHMSHNLGTLIRVLLQIGHLAVCAGMTAGRKEEVPLQKCFTFLQNFDRFSCHDTFLRL